MKDRQRFFRGGGSGRDSGAAFIRGLTEDEQKALLDFLRYFAARRYFGRLNCDDLAMQALVDVLSGRRGWNPEYTPVENLCLIVKSIASNQLVRGRRESPLDPNVPSANLSPADRYEISEARLMLRLAFHRVASGDPHLGRILAVAFDMRAWKPAEIAAELQISVTAVYNAGRRIRRRLMRMLDK